MEGKLQRRNTQRLKESTFTRVSIDVTTRIRRYGGNIFPTIQLLLAN
jgi:hypothetical protein